MGEIDKASFVLGELTGKLDEALKEIKDIKKDIGDINKSLTHVRIKNAGQAGIVAGFVAYLQDFIHRGA